jgi:hypothetical protein
MDRLTLGPWGQFVLLALAIVVVTLIAHRLLRPVVLRLVALSPILLAVVQRCDRPTQLLLPLAAFEVGARHAGRPAKLRNG